MDINQWVIGRCRCKDRLRYTYRHIRLYKEIEIEIGRLDRFRQDR